MQLIAGKVTMRGVQRHHGFWQLPFMNWPAMMNQLHTKDAQDAK
jgi:hypothetical protein